MKIRQELYRSRSGNILTRGQAVDEIFEDIARVQGWTARAVRELYQSDNEDIRYRVLEELDYMHLED